MGGVGVPVAGAGALVADLAVVVFVALVIEVAEVVFDASTALDDEDEVVP